MNRIAAIAGLLLGTTLFSSAAMAQTTLTMWYHGVGDEIETNIINQIVSDFNTSQSGLGSGARELPAGGTMTASWRRTGRQPAGPT